LGPTEPAAPSTPTEAHARLAAAVASFVAVVASQGRPLVLLLDDLQWADLASLALLESMLVERRDATLLVVGAWRDNEITSDHPLRAMLAALEDSDVVADLMVLAPLEPEDVEHIVTDAVGRDAGDEADLARLVHARTSGNPFFVRQFLLAMHRDGDLEFDHDAMAWRWDLARASSRSSTDNVAELLEVRLMTIPAASRRALQAASVIGTRFTLSSVDALWDDETTSCAQALDVALLEQLITPLDEQYRFVVGATADRSAPLDVDPSYAFLHDRVRQAALDSLDDAQRRRLHLARARALESSPSESPEVIVERASHLCEASTLLVDPDARLDAAHMLGSAASHAKSNMTVEAAARFLETAISLLPDDAWTTHADLTLRLHTEAADVAYIDGRHDDATTIASVVLARSSEPLDRVPVHNILIGVGVAKADYSRATQYALEVLEDDFAIKVPRHPGMPTVAVELARCRRAIGRRSTRELLALPSMSDPKMSAAMGIFMKTATNAYWAEPNLVPVIAARMIRLSLDHGNHELSAYGYALYAMVAGGVLGAEGTGYRYGRLSMDLLERRPDRSLTGRTALLWHGFVRHSRDPMRECAADLLDAYHQALAAGDVENACYCATVAFYASLLSGTSLPALTDRYAGYAEAVLRGGQEQTRGAISAWLQAVELLAGEQRQPVLAGERVVWTERRAKLAAAGDGTGIPTEGAAAAILAYLMGDVVGAEEHLALVFDHRDGAPGQAYLGPCFALYAATMLRRRSRGDKRRDDLPKLAWLRHLVRARAKHNPGDMQGFSRLVDAEAARADGDRARAVAAYLDAATHAASAGVGYLEAIALDEAGALEAEAGHEGQAAHLFSQANAAWRRVGVPSRMSEHVDTEVGGDGAGGATTLGELDQRTLIETVQAISREIEVDGLVRRVLSIAMRSAGATAGHLLLVDGATARPVATGALDDAGSIFVTASERGPDAGYLEEVVDFVMRTSSALLVEDALSNELVRGGRRQRDAARGSVLCAPLVQGGELVGAVYLANPHAIGVFTQRQLAVVETICGQAAVSLRNARLYEEQRAQAESFARFVPMAFLDQLGRARILDVGLGDAVSVDAAVLFSDVRGFTSISEGSGAVASFELLNAYLGRVEPAIGRHGGFVDKYVGDAIMSLFIDAPDGAVQAAVEMQHALATFNSERADGIPLRTGIGIHAGPMMLGTVGSADRLDTTAIGDTVNAASRLESATKEFCGAVLISSQVRDRLTSPGPLLLREVGRIRVVGKAVVLDVHEVLAARPEPIAQELASTREAFAAALGDWYAARFEAAARGFEACAAAAPSDELAAQFAARCARYAMDPPPGEWHGIDELATK
ncbi:MAG TPA: adenylate/guanylate cyclase domain-containing protein, partial [Acidimicrobiales bacterium]|nr:adenylate/guanylate cyclase domain-containing protein [Acidimicrobiales bacterium]